MTTHIGDTLLWRAAFQPALPERTCCGLEGRAPKPICRCSAHCWAIATNVLLFLISFLPAFHAWGASSELKRLGGYRSEGPDLGVAVSGNYAYVAEGRTNFLAPGAPLGFPEKLLAIDIRNPGKPQKAGEYASGPFSEFSVSGNHANLLVTPNVYELYADGLVRIDLSNPANPRQVNSYHLATPFRPPGNPIHMAASSNYVCVTMLYDLSRLWSHETFSSLLVLDITDPSNPKGPTELLSASASYAIGQTAPDAYEYSRPLAIAGQYAFQPPNVIDLTNGRKVGSISETGLPLKVLGSYLYLASDRLKIIDIRNPEKPQKAGEYPGGVSDVAVSGNYAYLAKGSSGLEVIDITDPAKPFRVAANSTFAAYRVTVAGGRVYVATFDRDLIILDEYQPETQSQIRFDQVSRGSQGELRLRLVGPTGVTGRLQHSPNLREWIDWKAVSFTGTAIDFSDPEISSARQRFYRVITP